MNFNKLLNDPDVRTNKQAWLDVIPNLSEKNFARAYFKLFKCKEVEVFAALRESIHFGVDVLQNTVDDTWGLTSSKWYSKFANITAVADAIKIYEINYDPIRNRLALMSFLMHYAAENPKKIWPTITSSSSLNLVEFIYACSLIRKVPDNDLSPMVTWANNYNCTSKLAIKFSGNF